MIPHFFTVAPIAKSYHGIEFYTLLFSVLSWDPF